MIGISNTTSKITTIKQKIVREDKDGKKFLILITNPSKIFVFDSNVPESEWDNLKEGQTYQMELKDGKHGDKTLKDFNRIITAEYNPKTKKTIVK